MENFRHTKDIAKAKSEIIYNIQNGGTAILNRDDKFFNYFAKIARKNKIKIKSFGYSKKSNVRFISISKNQGYFFLRLALDRKKILLKINNRNKSYIMNILSCAAVLDELNLDIYKVKNFLEIKLFKRRGKNK